MYLKSLRKFFLIILALSAPSLLIAADYDYAIKLKTGILLPESKLRSSMSATELESRHVYVQFSGPITQADKDQLASAGIEVLSYVPNFTFLALCNRLPSAAELDQIGIRWIGPVQAEHKISPEITEIGFRDYSRHPDNRVQMVIVFFADIDTHEIADLLIRDFDAEILGHNPLANAIDLILPEEYYPLLAELDEVMWIEQALPEPIELNNRSRSYTGAEIVHQPPMSVTGAGVVVAEWDGGRADAAHWDLRNRVTSLDYSSISIHATHVAGTVLGTGASLADFRYKGMAPSAELLTQIWWSTSSNAVIEYTEAINDYDARISTNSWGFGVGSITYANCDASLGTYASANSTLDNLVRGQGGAPISIAWSAGNERGTSSDYCGSIGWTYNTIGTLANAKNIVTVGSVSAYSDYMSSFSSWGPSDDGRIKPDVCGPGSSVTSCKPTSGYTTMSGTSMSTPAVAGIMALMLEQWDISFGSGELLPSSVKGILINTAIDMGRTGPDYEYGHGKVDAVAAVTKIGIGDPSWVQGEISTGESHVYDLTVPGGAERLKVTLVWDDPGGTVSSTEHLINNLDLVLIDPFGVENFPWTLRGEYPSWAALRGVDAVNNVETAELVNPVPGLWKAKVSGFNIPVGPQKYSIIFTPDSINTPGNLTAVAILDDGDQIVDPDGTTNVDFYVLNIGASYDSISVHLEDNAGWLNQTIDTVVYLAPYDSALIRSTATVPAQSLAGDQTILTCSGHSLSDTLAQTTNQMILSAAQTYILSVTTNVVEDTVSSPDLFSFDVTLSNLGNAGDVITLTPSGETDWYFTPPSMTIILNYDQDSVVSFEIIVPAEGLHLSENQIDVTATSSDDTEEVTSFVLVVNNPFFPPQLLAPVSNYYTQDGTPLFEWDSDGDSYHLMIGLDSAFESVVLSYQGLSETSYNLPSSDSLADGIYFWAVRKYVGADSSSLQRFPYELLVDNGIPRLLQTGSPADGSYVSNPSTGFSWFLAPGSAPATITPEYNVLQYASSADFSSDVVTVDTISLYGYNPPEPFGLGRWYWHVLRADSAGNSTPYTETATFVVDTEEPAVPILLTPEDGLALEGDTIEFTWSIGTPPPYEIAPHYYYMHISADGTFGDYNTFANFVNSDTVKVSSDVFTLFDTYWWRVKAYDSAGFFSDYSPIYEFTFGEGICGDLDGDDKVNLSDITRLIALVYLNGDPPEPLFLANVDCDDKINLADITRLIDFVYISKAPLCCSPL